MSLLQGGSISTILNSRWYQPDTKILSLFGSDMDLSPPAFIAEAIRNDVSEKRMFYGNVRGDEDVLEIVCSKLKIENNIKTKPNNICIVPGARFGFFLTSSCFLKANEEAIMVGAPAHPCLMDSNQVVGAKTIWNNLQKDDYHIDIKDLKRKINRRTRLLCIMNPSNPVGRVYKVEELKQILALAKKYNLTVLCDEIFEDLVYEGKHISFASLDEDAAERTVSLFCPAKVGNFIGLRVAYMVSSEKNMKLFEVMLGRLSAHTDRLSQLTVRSFIKDSKPWLSDLKEHLLNMRNYCMRRIEKLPGVKCFKPEAGRYMFLDLASYKLKSLEIAQRLKERAKLEVKPGILFGPAGEGHIRISFATSQPVLEEAFNRLETELKSGHRFQC